MFWNRQDSRKGKTPATETRPALPDGSALDVQALLDTMGALIRVLGRNAFDLDNLDAHTINQQCEQWARHVLVVAPYPGGEEVADPALPEQRNWHGLREFVTRLRAKEKAYVAHHLTDTRQIVGEFAQTLGKVFVSDQEDQTKINTLIRQLKAVVEGNAPLEIIKRESVRISEAIGRIMEERNERHTATLDKLNQKLQKLRDELDETKQELLLDPLTRIYNRQALEQELPRAIELQRLTQQPICLLMVDIDHFKQINDNFGHPAGDQTLKQFAACCLYAFPRKTDFVARYGGEEFAIIVQNTSCDTAAMLGDRLLQATRAVRVNHEQKVVTFTVSIGVAPLQPRDDPQAWLNRADKALYRAKGAGRDRLECQT